MNRSMVCIVLHFFDDSQVSYVEASMFRVLNMGCDVSLIFN